MENNEKVPELEKILEKNFAEMKIGEEKFQQDETTEQNIPRIDKKIIYQERYSSEKSDWYNNRQTNKCNNKGD